jgi:hypothetical protein
MPRKTSKVSKTFEVWEAGTLSKWELYLITIPKWESYLIAIPYFIAATALSDGQMGGTKPK